MVNSNDKRKGGFGKRVVSLMLCLALSACVASGWPLDNGTGKFVAVGFSENGSKCRSKIRIEGPESEVEQQVRTLLCQAKHAEDKAAWHEERAQLWEEINERQNMMGDLVSAGEPLAAFFARTHRHQKDKKLRQAHSLRQQAEGIRASLY